VFILKPFRFPDLQVFVSVQMLSKNMKLAPKEMTAVRLDIPPLVPEVETPRGTIRPQAHGPGLFQRQQDQPKLECRMQMS
jgi:hypothetical protein